MIMKTRCNHCHTADTYKLFSRFIKVDKKRVSAFLAEEVLCTAALISGWAFIYQYALKTINKKCINWEKKKLISPYSNKTMPKKEMKKQINKAWSGAKPSVNLAIKQAFNKLKNHNKKNKKADFSKIDRDAIYEALILQMEDYYENRYWFNIEPHLTTIFNNAFKNPNKTVADLLNIQKRVEQIIANEHWLNTLSAVNVGRAYNFGSIHYFNQVRIDEYAIEANMDDRTCPVCIRMDGTEFSVETAMNQIERFVAVGQDREAAIEIFPWPRVEDVDNLSASQRRDTDYTLPPYHGLCRCEVVAVGSDIMIEYP